MIFISTSCLKGENSKFTPDVFKVLEVYKELGIRNIELGAAHNFIKNIKPLFEYQKQTDSGFIIHGFFPPLKTKFMINPASQNQKQLENTIRIAKNAIELCRKLDSELYSLHSGLVADVNFDDNPISEIISEKKATENTINSLNIICDYASRYNVKIAIENLWGLSPLKNQNDFLNFLKEANQKNLGLLIDLGHLNISSKHNGFDKKSFIKKLQKHALEIHVHENDGTKDTHQKITNKNILADFDKDIIKKIAVTLEVQRLNKEEILQQKQFLEEAVK